MKSAFARGPGSAKTRCLRRLEPAPHQHLPLLTGSKRLSGSAPKGNYSLRAYFQEEPQEGSARPRARLLASHAAASGPVQGRRERPGVGPGG